MEFGKKIHELRIIKGLTLDVLAAKIGSSKGYLSGIENGKVHPPTDKFVRKLARIFGQDEMGMLKMAYLDRMPPDVRKEFVKILELK